MASVYETDLLFVLTYFLSVIFNQIFSVREHHGILDRVPDMHPKRSRLNPTIQRACVLEQNILPSLLSTGLSQDEI